MDLIEKHQKKLAAACKAHKVDRLYVFGSVLTDAFSPESDVDFIVSICADDPIDYAENYFALKFELESILNRKIDLLEEKAIRNRTFEGLVNQKKKLVYARRSQVVA